MEILVANVLHLFDGVASVQAHCKATRKRNIEKGNYQVTETCHYLVSSDGDSNFEKVLYVMMFLKEITLSQHMIQHSLVLLPQQVLNDILDVVILIISKDEGANAVATFVTIA